MCIGSGPSFPPPPPPPPPPPALQAPKKSSDDVKKARRQSESRARGRAGAQSTRLTGPRGILAPAQTGKSNLLGN